MAPRNRQSKKLLWTLLASLGLIVAPLLVFPEALGMPLALDISANLAMEMLFYGLALLALLRRQRIIEWFRSILICLAYRVVIGAVFGVIVAIAYSLEFSVALQLGAFSYLPAVLVQALATPFVLRAWLDIPRLLVGSRPMPAPSSTSDYVPTGGSSIVLTRDRKFRPAASQTQSTTHGDMPRIIGRSSESAYASPGEVTGFDRAVRYVGEHLSVQLAAVVDREGLLLANFRRGTVDPEDWAPLALVFVDANRAVLDRHGLTVADKVDLVLKDRHIVVARDDQFALLVVADRQADETLNIRIHQALEAMRRFVAERYGQKVEINAERAHVPSA